MTLHLDHAPSPSSPSRWRLCATTLALSGALGCGLIGVEPDEIDVLEGDTGSVESDSGTDEGASGMTGVTTDPGGETSGGAEETQGGSTEGAEAASCEDLDPIPLELGFNAVSIEAGASLFEAVCGGPGPERLFSFTADSSAELRFELTGELASMAVLYWVDGCEPPSVQACDPMVINGVEVDPGDTVYLFVDGLAADEAVNGELLVQTL